MAGAGYKLFTTGSVLTAADVNTYLNEQTVMVFNDATARTTALSGVLAEGMLSYLKDTDAVQYYNGSSWTTINTDQTPLTTKGDLFTYSTTDARLAVGNNGETLVADSSTTTGLRWTGANQQNPVINSSYDIWQRGTSIAVGAGYAYTADRWEAYRGALVAGMTVSRQSTNDTTNLPFIQYCARVQRDSGNTGTQGMNFGTNFETINSIPYVGRTITLSFYARAGSNYSTSANALSASVFTGTGTDQNYGKNYSGVATAVSGTATLTTTWQRFSYTGTVATTATELAIYFQNTPSGTAGANDFYEITGVQIDIGSVALPYRRNSATLGGELAACQRYYFLHVSGNDQSVGMGGQTSATDAFTYIKFPVNMRTAPTSASTSGTDYYRFWRNGSGDNFNSWTILRPTTSGALLYNNTEISGAANNTGYFDCINPSAFIAFTSEL